MSTLTPYTASKLQEKYLKSGVMEGGWLGIYPYHWRVIMLLSVVIVFLPESWVSKNDFLMDFSYFFAEKIRIILGLDMVKGTLKMYSPNVCLLYRVVVFLSLVICFFYNLVIKSFRFKEKVNYYWASNYWRSSSQRLLILFLLPLFLCAVFYLGIINSPSVDSYSRWQSFGRSRFFMAINGFGILFFFQGFFFFFFFFFLGGVEMLLGYAFKKVFY